MVLYLSLYILLPVCKVFDPVSRKLFYGVCTAPYTNCEKDPVRLASSLLHEKKWNCLHLHFKKTQKPTPPHPSSRGWGKSCFQDLQIRRNLEYIETQFWINNHVVSMIASMIFDQCAMNATEWISWLNYITSSKYVMICK
jgi:hypothetical protein